MQEEILDEEVLATPSDSSNLASATTRFVTYIIDVIIYYAISFVIGLIAGATAGTAVAGFASILAMLSFFLYYIIMEAALGKTVGKMVMKTRVIDVNGGKPSAGQVILRTIVRIVPFEFISVWIEDPVMWHDKWASTRVIQE